MMVRYTQFLLLWFALAGIGIGTSSAADPEDVQPTVGGQEISPPGGGVAPTPADPLERRIGEILERTQKIHAGEAIRATESTSRHRQRRTELSNLREQLDVAMSMPPASTARTEQIDQTWSSLRNLVIRLQDDRFQALTALETATADRARVAQETPNSHKSNPRIQQAMDAFVQAHQARVSAVEIEIDATSKLMARARVLRRQARVEASEEAIQSTDLQRLEEIKAEIVSIPLDLQSSFRTIRQAWWKNPDELSHVQALGSLFLGLMELAFLLIIGLWAHSQTPQWTRRIMVAATPERGGEPWANSQQYPAWVIPGDLRSLAPPLSALLQDLLILALALTVIFWLGPAVPLIGWLALVFAAGACIRGAQSLVSLALITPTENRPGLRVTSPEARKACLWLIQGFGLLKAIEVVVVHLLVIILGADRIGQLFTEVIDLVMWLLAAVSLLRWGDLLRSRVQSGGTESGLSRWVVASGSSKLSGLLGALIGVLILGLRLLGGLTQGVIDRRGGLAWLGALLARRQLRDAGQESLAHLAAPVRRSIASGALQGLRMDEEAGIILQRFQTWKQDPRQGLVAITGDRGLGKNVLMAHLAQSIDGPTTDAITPIGHTSEEAALRWLASVANIDQCQSAEDLIIGLKKLPPTTFLLSNLNRLFLRAVGHYDGLDAVLEVMQATGRHHFWVASLHGPAWSFLHGMSHVGHVNVFSLRIHLSGLDPAELSQWLNAQTRRAGIAPDFGGLVHKRRGGPDHERMLERAERAYWRLLTDSSQGNPSVAIRLWMDSLRPSGTAGDGVSVALFRSHNMGELEELSDDELFALTALIIHDDLTVSELHTVLNQAESSVRALCRGLEQRTLITETEAGRYKVRLNWLPAVERHLRRRSFMHKS